MANYAHTFTSGETVTPTKLNNARTISDIVTADLADASVTTAKIADANVTTAKIADANVTTAKIADANVTTAKIADGAVTQAKLNASVTLVPAGAIMPFAMNSAPSGWLAANGAAVSRTEYAGLFSAIGTTHGAGNGSTTFNLPDLRGYFIRGFGTNSDGTASAAFGVKQEDAFQGHWHAGADGAGYGATANSAATTVTTGGGNNTRVNGWQPINGTDSLGNSYGSVRTSTETRPRNIALLYCIKF